MAKILISFVGTGSLLPDKADDKNHLKSAREYRVADYHLGQEDLGKHSFVAGAITGHCEIDKVVLIGTVHSMWEEVYRYFCEKNGLEIDENAYCDISEYCEKATSDSQLNIPHKDKIEAALGKDSHVLLIKYGASEEEINDNISIVLGLNNLINTGDEIVVDITHSFRSLPIVVMNLLLYLTTVSNKKPVISHIYYGMMEMIKELGYTPIVDLIKIQELNKWIVGASAFKNYGNAYQIAELLKGVDTDSANRLKQFSDILNLNHLDKVEKEIDRLRRVKAKNYDSLLPELTVKPVVNDFLKQFGTVGDNHALFQYNLAKWQFGNMNYALSLISLQESILTYACQLAEKDWENQSQRQKVKDTIMAKKSELPEELSKCYNDVRELRNCVAHSLKMDNSPKNIISTLRKKLDLAGKYITKSADPF